MVGGRFFVRSVVGFSSDGWSVAWSVVDSWFGWLLVVFMVAADSGW